MENELKNYKVSIDFYYSATDEDDATGIADMMANCVESEKFMDNHGHETEVEAKVNEPHEIGDDL